MNMHDGRTIYRFYRHVSLRLLAQGQGQGNKIASDELSSGRYNGSILRFP